MFQLKKFALPLALGFSLMACQKQTKEAVKPSTISLNERTPKEISERLHTQNDTVYVTNFFATWCGPCIKEIPHFKEVLEETKGQPIKFTFISLDDKNDWDTQVRPFIKKQGIEPYTVMVDAQQLSEAFFSENFKTWDGSFIPFTFIRKGKKVEEIVGGISNTELEHKIKSLQ